MKEAINIFEICDGVVTIYRKNAANTWDITRKRAIGSKAGTASIKRVAANEKYAMRQAIPYVGAKPMFMPEDTEDAATLKNIVEDTYSYLAAQPGEKKTKK